MKNMKMKMTVVVLIFVLIFIMIFVKGEAASAEKQERQDTTVAFAATSTRNFLVCVPFFSFTLLVLFLCCLFAFAANAQREVQIPDLSVPNM